MSSKDTPKILVIGLGGTWCMKHKKSNEASPFNTEKIAEELGNKFDLTYQFPALTSFCIPTFKELMALDSSNLEPKHWTEVAQLIEKIHQNYDGIVVMQGTDTLSFTAAALSFALTGLDKPVILSGAQIEMGSPGSDAPNNLVNACRVAALRTQEGIPAVQEVAVVFGSRIILGTRCRKYSERDLEAFNTVNAPLLGSIRISIRLNPSVLQRPTWSNDSNFSAATAFNNNVMLLYVFPGLNPATVTAIGSQSSGLVLAAYGAGNIPCETASYKNPYSLESSIRTLVDSGVPVIVTTQCVTGAAEVGLYETGSAAKKAGAIVANDMTPEAAYTKLAWVLANESRWPKKAKQALRGGPGRMGGIRTAMLTSLAGEITENPELYGLFGL